jgi:hypothetical protein
MENQIVEILSNNMKYQVVIAVLTVILIGTILMLFRMNKKITQLEVKSK